MILILMTWSVYSVLIVKELIISFFHPNFLYGKITWRISVGCGSLVHFESWKASTIPLNSLYNFILLFKHLAFSPDSSKGSFFISRDTCIEIQIFYSPVFCETYERSAVANCAVQKLKLNLWIHANFASDSDVVV